MVSSVANSIMATNAGNNLLAGANAQIALARNTNANSDSKALLEKEKQLQSDRIKNELSYEANMAIADSMKKAEKEKQKHKLCLLA